MNLVINIGAKLSQCFSMYWKPRNIPTENWSSLLKFPLWTQVCGFQWICNQLHIFQYICTIYCVELQWAPLKFHKKKLTIHWKIRFLYNVWNSSTLSKMILSRDANGEHELAELLTNRLNEPWALQMNAFYFSQGFKMVTKNSSARLMHFGWQIRNIETINSGRWLSRPRRVCLPYCRALHTISVILSSMPLYCHVVYVTACINLIRGYDVLINLKWLGHFFQNVI